MNRYRVRLTRLVEQETAIDVDAPNMPTAATRALEHAGADLLWIDSGCQPHSHAVIDVTSLTQPANRIDLGQFEAAAFARDQRLQRR